MVEGMWKSITESRPARRSGLGEWYRAVIEEQERSGLSVSEAAERVGAAVTTLYRWKRRLSRCQEGSHEQPARGLVQVRVRDAEGRACEPRRPLVVRLTHGRAIEVPAGFDADELARLIGVVAAC